MFTSTSEQRNKFCGRHASQPRCWNEQGHACGACVHPLHACRLYIQLPLSRLAPRSIIHICCLYLHIATTIDTCTSIVIAMASAGVRASTVAAAAAICVLLVLSMGRRPSAAAAATAGLQVPCAGCPKLCNNACKDSIIVSGTCKAQCSAPPSPSATCEDDCKDQCFKECMNYCTKNCS